jgi:hypothetical protein
MSERFIDRAKRFHEQIRKALMNDWDPIGVKGISGAEDEYDGYVPTIYKMLIQSKTEEEIFDYLWWVETEHMGLFGNRQATEAFAGLLMGMEARVF